jgi:hypothetical protein
MESSTIARPVRQIWLRLPLMLGLVLVAPHAALHAASNATAAVDAAKADNLPVVRKLIKRT